MPYAAAIMTIHIKRYFCASSAQTMGREKAYLDMICISPIIMMALKKRTIRIFTILSTMDTKVFTF